MLREGQEFETEHLPVLNGDEINEKLFQKLPVDSLKDKNVLVVCEDNTRATPVHIFFPEFLQRIKDLNAHVRVLFALGTHRPMSEKEMSIKLGLSETQAESIRLQNHDATDEEQLVEVGKINGNIFKINRSVEDSDTIITISSVLPHRVVGFSGGAKMLCLGIGNKEFIDYTHRASNQFPEDDIIGTIDNPMRKILDQQGRMVEQKYPDKNFYCISAITVPDGIVQVFVDSFQHSYEQAASLSKDIFVKEVGPQDAILALVDDKSTDLWQAAKAIYNCARVLKDGGIIVVRGTLKDGVSVPHGKEILEYGYSNPTKIKELSDAGIIKNQLVASHMTRVSEHLQRVKIVICSENITEKMCKRLHVGYLDPEELDESVFSLIVHHAVDVLLKKKITNKSDPNSV